LADFAYFYEYIIAYYIKSMIMSIYVNIFLDKGKIIFYNNFNEVIKDGYCQWVNDDRGPGQLSKSDPQDYLRMGKKQQDPGSKSRGAVAL
jgi:hypothetical protein